MGLSFWSFYAIIPDEPFIILVLFLTISYILGKSVGGAYLKVLGSPWKDAFYAGIILSARAEIGVLFAFASAQMVSLPITAAVCIVSILTFFYTIIMIGYFYDGL